MSVKVAGFVSVVRSLAEPSLVILTGILLVGVLSVPLMPVTSFEMPLRPIPDAAVAERDVLTRQIAEIESLDRAEVLLVDGSSRLVLFGVTDIHDITPRIHELLSASGYQVDEFRPRVGGDIESMVAADPALLRSSLAIQALVLGALGWAFGRRRQLIDPQAPPPVTLSKAALFGLAAGGLAIAGNLLVSEVQELLGFPTEEQAWIVELLSDPHSAAQLAPWVVLIVPISEELIFRFYAMRFIAHHAGAVTAMISSSLMFAVVHLNPSGMLAYTTIGFVLAWSYRRTGRLLVPILAHTVHNGLALTLTLLFPEIA